MFSCGRYPNEVSISSRVAAESRLCVRSRSAWSGLPGMKRGMKKFSVSAAHRVTTKKPSRRSTYLNGCAPLLGGLGPEVQQHLLRIGDVERGRLRVRVVLGRPALDVGGVVLEPVHRLGHR